jgi:hypothetical protein
LEGISVRFKLLIALVVAGLLVQSPAIADGIITFTFDENGNGTASDGSNRMALHTIAGQPTLAYDITGSGVGAITPGDVLVREPILTAQVPSDLLRFTAQGLLLVYSDFETSGPRDLADVGGFGTPYSTNAVFKDEVGLENGLNGLPGYTPGAGDPGASVAGLPLVYNFISDTPEPASIALAGIGALGLLGYRLWRRKPANG